MPSKKLIAGLLAAYVHISCAAITTVDTAFETIVPARATNILAPKHFDQVVGEKPARAQLAIPKGFPPFWLVQEKDNGIVIAAANDESTLDSDEHIVSEPKQPKPKKKAVAQRKRKPAPVKKPAKFSCSTDDDILVEKPPAGDKTPSKPNPAASSSAGAPAASIKPQGK